MTLEYQIDTLDGLDESVSKLYLEKDGKFVLDMRGHESAENKDRIPLSRLNAEIDKRKDSEKALQAVVDGLIEAIPEDMRDVVPDLPAAKKISWIQAATKKGLFESKAPDSLDTRRPGGTPSKNFDEMSPQAKMATGYKTK